MPELEDIALDTEEVVNVKWMDAQRPRKLQDIVVYMAADRNVRSHFVVILRVFEAYVPSMDDVAIHKICLRAWKARSSTSSN